MAGTGNLPRTDMIAKPAKTTKEIKANYVVKLVAKSLALWASLIDCREVRWRASFASRFAGINKNRSRPGNRHLSSSTLRKIVLQHVLRLQFNDKYNNGQVSEEGNGGRIRYGWR